ncbi:MAG: radical SAM protein [Candidatus Lokiarchaeota archaeon]|nr:radical SAM protein [Candidatus Lokiarchaeota archaeon]
MSKKKGTKIVLTASEIEMSDFKNNPFVAFMGGFPYRFPVWTSKALYWPALDDKDDFTACFAPYGLRKVEGALLECGFKREDIAVVQYNNLKRFVGLNTKVVGISSMDPLGLAYVSQTYSAFLGFGEIPGTLHSFQKLLAHKVFKKNPNLKIVVGGAGAWQLGKKAREFLGIDHIVLGEIGVEIGKVFKSLIKGKKIPEVIKIKNQPAINEIPTISEPSVHGVVEISRGCGRNCQFCSPTMRKKRDIPISCIINEIKMNLKYGGDGMITFATEDLFLYKCDNKKFYPNSLAVIDLLEKVAGVPGVKYIQPAHISLAPVVADPELVQEAADILINYCRYEYHGEPVITAETGLETGSVRLVKKYMRGKALPFKPDQWPEIVEQAIGILNDNNWTPAGTLLIGLPEENEDDSLRNLELLDDIFNYKIFLIPLLFINLQDCILRNEDRAIFNELNETQLEFFLRSWEHNLHIYKKDWLDADDKSKIENFGMKMLAKFIFGGGYLLYYKWHKDPIFKMRKHLMKEIIDLKPIDIIRDGIRSFKKKFA